MIPVIGERRFEVNNIKVGDLVRSTSAFLTGYIVGITYNEFMGKCDIVYDIQWFGIDGPNRMTETWFKPLIAEVQGE
jgi:hypothetical protein